MRPFPKSLLILFILFLGCASQAFSQEETGLASWYGPGLHANITAGGEVFDMNKLTAAHPSLPFDTRVRVTNLKNKKSVIVRINDRGPFIKNRIIDVSMEAARNLDILHSGIARVKVEVLDDEIADNIRLFPLPNPIPKKSIRKIFGVTRQLDDEAFFNSKRNRSFPYAIAGSDEAD